MKDNYVHKTLMGTFWLLCEKLSAEGMSFIISIILARLLTPDDFGEVALVISFVTILQVFVTSGFSDIVVREKNIDDIFISSALLVNIIVSAILYILLFLISNRIAFFFHNSHLSLVIKILGIRLPISAINSIEQAVITRNMEFRKFFWATLIGTLVSGIIGILFALYGLGIWALIIQNLGNILIDTITLFFLINEKKFLRVKLEYIVKIFEFGWRLVLSSFLSSVYSEFRTLLIGRVYPTKEVGYFNNGRKIPGLIVNNVADSIGKSVYPAYAAQQNELSNLYNIVRKTIRGQLYIVIPLMLGLSVVTPKVISILFTEKWSGCIFFMRIFSICYIFKPLTSTYSHLMRALGKTKEILYISFSTITVNIIITLYTIIVMKNIRIMSLGILIGTIIEVVLYMLNVKKSIAYRLKDQISDWIQPTVMSFGTMYIISLLDGIKIDSDIIVLFLQIIVGIAVYIIISKITNNKEFKIICTIVKGWKAKFDWKN